MELPYEKGLNIIFEIASGKPKLADTTNQGYVRRLIINSDMMELCIKKKVGNPRYFTTGPDCYCCVES